MPRQKANGKRQSDRRQKALKANTARPGQDEHTADNDVINIEIHVTATVMGVVEGVGLIKINVYFALLLLIKNRLQQQIENLNVTQKYLANFISSPLPFPPRPNLKCFLAIMQSFQQQLCFTAAPPLVFLSSCRKWQKFQL